MNYPDRKIVNFIKQHHVLTLAVCKNNQPWCCNCFYSYIENEAMFVFTTETNTRHGAEMIENSMVSGSVVLETKIIGKIQGIQFSGEIIDAAQIEDAKFNYMKRFPFAVLMDTKLWVIKLNYIKFTDNSFGFGKKLIWERN
jgi:uncharacterized protein YhbP (UPF0306 family)